MYHVKELVIWLRTLYANQRPIIPVQDPELGQRMTVARRIGTGAIYRIISSQDTQRDISLFKLVCSIVSALFFYPFQGFSERPRTMTKLYWQWWRAIMSGVLSGTLVHYHHTTRQTPVSDNFIIYFYICFVFSLPLFHLSSYCIMRLLFWIIKSAIFVSCQPITLSLFFCITIFLW